MTLIGQLPFAGKIALRINSVGISPGLCDIPTTQLTFDLRQPYYVKNENNNLEVCIKTDNNQRQAQLAEGRERKATHPRLL